MEGGGGEVFGYRAIRGVGTGLVTNYFDVIRKLFGASSRLYMQDHSRGRGLTTTGQPTVSLLPLIILAMVETT